MSIPCDSTSASGATANLELRPPLTGRLLSVSVNGRAHTDFDGQSVTIVNTPAEVICRTSEAG